MKEFDIMTSYENILKSVENHLQDIEKNIPSSVSQNLKNLINQLEFKSFNLYEMFSNKDVYEYVQEKNLNILKRDIIPFISKYIKTTHDMGQVRDSITLLTLAVAKYESTNINNFEKTLDMLFMNSEIKEALGLKNISLSGDPEAFLLLPSNNGRTQKAVLGCFFYLDHHVANLGS